MRYWKTTLIFLMMLVASGAWGQDTIPQTNIPTLNRIAGEYDFWKWVFGIAAAVLAVWSFFGLKFFVKAKAEEWIVGKIAKETELKVEYLKAAVREFAHITELKKKRILVISMTEGQQGVVKKALDGCGFSEYEWKSIVEAQTFTLEKTDLILLNDYPDSQLTEAQIETVMKRFITNVAYFYFGPKRLKDAEYRQNYGIALDFCNSPSRIEAGILSLLKIA